MKISTIVLATLTALVSAAPVPTNATDLQAIPSEAIIGYVPIGIDEVGFVSQADEGAVFYLLNTTLLEAAFASEDDTVAKRWDWVGLRPFQPQFKREDAADSEVEKRWDWVGLRPFQPQFKREDAEDAEVVEKRWFWSSPKPFTPVFKREDDEVSKRWDWVGLRPFQPQFKREDVEEDEAVEKRWDWVGLRPFQPQFKREDEHLRVQ